jgi:hypothetical protein
VSAQDVSSGNVGNAAGDYRVVFIPDWFSSDSTLAHPSHAYLPTPVFVEVDPAVVGT